MGAQVRIGQVDLETGEVLGGALVYVSQRPKMKGRWFMAIQESLLELARDRSITGEQWRVLMLLVGLMGYENIVTFKQSDAAEHLGIAKQTFNRALRALERKGLVSRSSVEGVRVYRVSESVCWKGRVTALNSAREKRLRVVGQKASAGVRYEG